MKRFILAAFASAALSSQASAQPPHIPSSGLIAYYGFDSTITDATASAILGLTPFNQPDNYTTRSTGDYARLFNGIGNLYANSNSVFMPSAPRLSIAAWVRYDGSARTTPLSSNQFAPIASYGPTNPQSYSLYLKETTSGEISLCGQITQTNSNIPTNREVCAVLPSNVRGQWQHVAMSVGDSIRIYVGGFPVASLDIPSDGIFYPPTTNYFRVGAFDGGDSSTCFNGAIDALGIWGDSLSACQIYNIATQTYGPGPIPQVRNQGDTLLVATVNTTSYGVQYQWYDCNSGQDIPNATQSTFAPTVSGSYNVYVSTPCVSRVPPMAPCVSVTVDTQTVVNVQNIPQVGWRLSPNPAHDQIQVQADTDFDAELFDATGRLVAAWRKQPPYSRLPLQSFPRGVYVLRLKNDRGQQVEKIILE